MYLEIRKQLLWFFTSFTKKRMSATSNCIISGNNAKLARCFLEMAIVHNKPSSSSLNRFQLFNINNKLWSPKRGAIH